MPISVQWANDEHNVMLTVFEGQWDLDDFYKMVADGKELLKDVDYPFITIVDYSKSLTPPRRTLSVGRHVERVHNPNRLRLIWVKPGMFIEMLYATLGKIHPRGFGDSVTVDTLEDAYALADKFLKETERTG